MWQKKDIVNEFQRLGKRITKQRMVILDVILEQNWTDRTIRMLEEMGVLKRVYQYVFTDETGVRADGENEVIAPEFHGKNGLRQTEKEEGKCCSFSAS